MVGHAVSGAVEAFRFATLVVQQTHLDAFQDVYAPGRTPLELLTVNSSEGQAETVAMALSTCLRTVSDTPVLVVNCDGVVDYPVEAFCQQAQGFAAAVAVFADTSPIYSYVDEFPLFTACLEKQPVSPWAVAGLYYFRSAREVVATYLDQRRRNMRHKGELYLSGLLSLLPGPKLAVAMARDHYINWGTPDDVVAYLPTAATA